MTIMKRGDKNEKKDEKEEEEKTFVPGETYISPVRGNKNFPCQGRKLFPLSG